eukprot:10409767-Alexandrium_andersonii.AAC.1
MRCERAVYVCEDAFVISTDGAELGAFVGILDAACARAVHGFARGAQFRAYLANGGLSWGTGDVMVSMRGVGA